ncbi:hypothetical protein IEA_05289 [Bacillus toyonensis]|nr:hypothetical protein IEA_05289 [Bacillus toyonensis]
MRFLGKIKRVAIIYDLTLCLRSDELLHLDSSVYFHVWGKMLDESNRSN